ncbi:hypothetical protein [Bradyrhizobium macuxiense]|uniref:hypothetical protein n=1 Tax=Bradyrhizobium macuxiense TaxID=1755647 RepID=UPI00142EF18E|nr:hypothetical protein [Bradyrhizobium macuxiense]
MPSFDVIDPRTRKFRAAICFRLANECGQGSLQGTRLRTTKCEGERTEVPYSTLPIFFTAAINRALSSATNFENPGAATCMQTKCGVEGLDTFDAATTSAVARRRS